MMMVLKRKEVLIGSLILLIGVAAFINFNYAQVDENPALSQASSSEVTQAEETEEAGNAAEPTAKMGEAQLVSADMSDYFSQARVNRESARSTTIARFNEIIDNPNVDAQTRQQAQDSLLDIAGVADRETAAENMIRAKGFSDAVVYISGDMASVTVKASALTEAEVAKLQDIVASQAGIEIKNIKIVEVE